MLLRWFSVQSNSDCLKFSLQQSSLFRSLCSIQNHENEIACLCAFSNTPFSYSRVQTFAADITCLPRPLPSAAPSMIPGRSRIWISAPPYSKTPGIAVSVVKAYAATSLFVLVILDKNVDLPTEGKPTRAILASPLLLTSKPVPPPPPEPGPGSSSWARNRASFL